MMNAKCTSDRATKWMRWIARVLGTLASVFWVTALTLSAIFEKGPITPEGVMLAGLVATNAVGVFIAWRRERIGGTVTVIGAVALCVFAFVTAGHNKGFAMLVSGGLFLIPGILFLASWRRTRK